MSWLNNSLSTIKGQLTTLAHELVAETAGPGDEEYRGPEVDSRTALELLTDTQKEKEVLDKLCSDKDSEIALLRKQISELQNKISDSGGGGNVTAAAASSTSGRTSKSPTDHAILEDSWCWEPDNGKQDNDHSSETSSSGNGNEMVNITLEEVSLGTSAKANKRAQRLIDFQKRIQQLEDENKQLNAALEELDSQHNLAMQNVLELKTGLQAQFTAVSKDYEALKKEHAEKFINGELELGKVKKQLEVLQAQNATTEAERETMLSKIEFYDIELKRALEEMADLQTLLEKKSHDNVELIERVKAAGKLADKVEEERAELQLKIETLEREVEEAKKAKEKKTSESSTSSTGKQSEDEFIVVREGDASSSGGPTTPPTKEELKDKIVQLENRVSELTLENGSLALKLQDSRMEKDLSANVLRENLQAQEEELRATKELLEEQGENMLELRERAAEAVLAQEKLKALTDEKQRIEIEIDKMKDSLQTALELEKRLLFSEQEKESLQLELQALRTADERAANLESKLQKLTMENQHLKLNAEAETETLNNSAELEDKLKTLTEENESLRAELESIAQAKFRQAIAEEKQEITDLDADEEDCGFSMDKLREVLAHHLQPSGGGAGDDEDALQKSCKLLYEKLSKIKSLEKSLAYMSEEVLDLQDSKIVWDHKKKTLEADISQYILQCDELMKNNEILLNELENYKRNKLETIHEHNEESILHLETQLEESSKLNQSLESEYGELNRKNDELERDKQELTEQLRVAQQAKGALEALERDFKLQVETLELEKCNMMFELNELRSTDTRDKTLSDALNAAEDKCESLELQLARLSKDHADLVAAMQAQKAALVEANRKREDTEKALSEQLDLVQSMHKDIEGMQAARQVHAAASDRSLHELEARNVQLTQQQRAKDIAMESLQEELKSLKERSQEADVLIEDRNFMEQQLQENQQFLANLRESLHAKSTLEESLRAELLVAQEKTVGATELEELKAAKDALAQEHQQLQELYESQTSKLDALQCASASDTAAIARIAQLEAELLATADLQKSVETLNYEKNEMIKALQQKHSENMQYYMEIQRLQPVVQQLQQNAAAEAAKPCEKCPALESALSEMRKEQEMHKDQINFLKEKSDILTTNLLTEQTNQRLVQQQKMDVEEQNAAISKDVERLRQHLLEIEDMHTQETMQMQRELDETKAKMTALQHEVSKSSTAYTSASIRANQHAETLQAQYALVVQQRDELVNKLSSAEDRESKNQAALCNLQCALEQFQNDKENDIKAATQRIRRELQQEVAKETLLQSEIAALNQQLADANQGLRAASRLSDQLEACQQTIAALREEVETLKQQNVTLAEKLTAAESSQSDKIDKNLIKSLLIGYVVSGNPNDKHQVLRMISSVLEFTAMEADKVGLNKQQSSWLGAILGSGAQGAHTKDNLVQAFVEFLEQESQPNTHANNMPNLLNITQTSVADNAGTATSGVSTPAAMRRTSVGSNSGAATTSLPIQLNSNVLSEFAPSRNSSSILKDILSDS